VCARDSVITMGTSGTARPAASRIRSCPGAEARPDQLQPESHGPPLHQHLPRRVCSLLVSRWPGVWSLAARGPVAASQPAGRAAGPVARPGQRLSVQHLADGVDARGPLASRMADCWPLVIAAGCSSGPRRASARLLLYLSPWRYSGEFEGTRRSGSAGTLAPSLAPSRRLFEQ
jgi:hypothetical protein